MSKDTTHNKLKKTLVCSVASLPVRREPMEQSEMISQVLYGEEVEILSAKDNWIRIKLIFDNYEGWVDKKCIEELNIDLKATKQISDKLFEKKNINNKSLLIPAGAEYYEITEPIGDNIPTPQNIVKTANLFLGIPYLWGGRSSYGCDCSGFVQTVFKINNIKLPRDAHLQVEHGSPVEFFDMIKPADLVFFGDTYEKITHVGIALGENKIIHSSGCVRIDSLNHQGIYNHDKKNYTHQLRVIKRLII